MNKITTDFAGAKKHWKTEMRGWTFVHNDTEGLPPDVVKKIDSLQKRNKPIAIETWPPPRLQIIAMTMPRTKLVMLFGRPPQRQDFDRLTFKLLRKV